MKRDTWQSDGKTVWKHGTRLAVIAGALLMLSVWILNYATGRASAGPLDALMPFANLGIILIAMGVLIGLLGLVLRKFGGEQGEAVAMPAIAIAAVAVSLGIAG